MDSNSSNQTLVYLTTSDASQPLSSAASAIASYVASTVTSAVFSFAKTMLPLNSAMISANNAGTSSGKENTTNNNSALPPIDVAPLFSVRDLYRKAERIVMSPWNLGNRVAAVSDSLVIYSTRKVFFKKMNSFCYLRDGFG